jgi:hypothetical protein
MSANVNCVNMLREPLRRLCSMASAALVSLFLLTSATEAAAAGSSFELAQVIEQLQRELAAVDRNTDANAQRVRIDEAQVALDLVEIGGKGGPKLVVPGADFVAGKEEQPKSALKRRMVVDLESVRGTGSDEAGGSLSRAVSELKSSVSAGIDAHPAYALKRVSLDLEFAIDRGSKGEPSFVVFTGERKQEVRNAQKLKLKLVAKEN